MECTAPKLSRSFLLGAFIMVIPASRRLKCWKVLLMSATSSLFLTSSTEQKTLPRLLPFPRHLGKEASESLLELRNGSHLRSLDSWTETAGLRRVGLLT